MGKIKKEELDCLVAKDDQTKEWIEDLLNDDRYVGFFKATEYGVDIHGCDISYLKMRFIVEYLKEVNQHDCDSVETIYKLQAHYEGTDGYGFNIIIKKDITKQFKDIKSLQEYVDNNRRIEHICGHGVSTILFMTEYHVDCVSIFKNINKRTFEKKR